MTAHVWLAMDLETRRVLAQDRDFGEADFPPGPRGAGWPLREIDVPTDLWDQMVAGQLDGDRQDQLHRQWWDQAAPPGSPPWPLLPGEGND